MPACKATIFFDVGPNVVMYFGLTLKEGIEAAIMFEPDQTNARLISKTQQKNRRKNSCLLEPV